MTGGTKAHYITERCDESVSFVTPPCDVRKGQRSCGWIALSGSVPILPVESPGVYTWRDVRDARRSAL